MGEARAVPEGRRLGDMMSDWRADEARDAEGEPGVDSAHWFKRRGEGYGQLGRDR